ncbi:TonB-dependent receptor [Chryseolinea lacunae]|nr:TonB-dependent receptor [Chryseolinea lacunae]
MKYLYMWCLLLCVALTASAQQTATTGAVRGTVKTSDGTAAEFVSVRIEGNGAKGSTAGADGKYTINRVAPGSYTLVASFIGLETQKQTVEVRAGETTVADFVLSEDASELQEVVVSEGRLSAESPYVSKMPLKNLENSQVYNSVPNNILIQQAVTNFDDALRNVPGVQKLWESTGRGGDGASYYALRGFEAQATVVNGLPGLTNGSLDPSNIERIEVVKGPSGTLFGSSLVSYGGLINTVTKKPYHGFGGSVGYIAGSFGLNRITADINTPLGNDNVLLRVNTAYQTENSFQDAGFRNSFFIAPTLTYKASEKLSFTFVTEFMQEEKTNQAMLFLGRDTPLQYKNLDDLNYNRKLSLTSNDLSMKNPRYNLQAIATYKISDQWTSQTVISRGSAKSTGYYSYLYDTENGKREFALWITNMQAQTLVTDIQQNFIGDFKIGNMRNRLVVGLDYYGRNLVDNGSGWSWVHNVNAQGDVNYIYPYTGDEMAPTYLTRSSIDKLLSTTTPSANNTRDGQYSAYFSDVINITPQLLAQASLRVDYFDNEGDILTEEDDQTQTALSPKFGLIYQVLPDRLSVFANYLNGFKNVASRTYGQGPSITQTFKPEHANQWEAGVKMSLLAERLNGTISYYDITLDNVVTGGTATTPSLQGGQVRSKGFEFDVNASPVKGLALLAGFSHNDSKVVRGDEANIWLETGRRPIYSGPANQVNLWATYTLTAGSLEGLGFGIGGNYSSQLAILDSQVTGTFYLPEYVVGNASVFFNASKYRIGFNLNNITNKYYYTGYSTINPQKPRNATLSLVYKF